MTDAKPETVREIVHQHLALSLKELDALTLRIMAAAERELCAVKGQDSRDAEVTAWRDAAVK